MEIIDFAIENNCCGVLFAGNWLITAGQINDREPAHSQRDACLYQHTLIIWTAMLDNSAHMVKYRGTFFDSPSLSGFPEINKSGYTTHMLLLSRNTLTVYLGDPAFVI